MPDKAKTQIDKFKEAAREVETDDREEAFDAIVKKIARSSPDRKVCPECGHEFRGSGWDGIDAHWKSKHDHIMPYSKAWPLIQSGKYSK
jgi:hypothetical protein